MADDAQDQIADSLSDGELIGLARMDFGAFVELVFPVLHNGQRLIHAPYIDVVVEVLDFTKFAGERIIINMPPGYMKSLLVSVLYTAWLLGKDPGTRIICASYGDDLAHDLSRKTRQVMVSAIYKRIFPGTILVKKAEDNITTTKGGQRYATAVGSDIGGFRANLVVIDDPNQPDDAVSELAKQKVRDWYEGSIEQRLLDGGSIILVMHRLATDDFTQTLIDKGGWFLLKLPLIAEEEEIFSDGFDRVLSKRMPGDPLNPYRLSDHDVRDLNKRLRADIIASHYQQRPLYGGSGVCSIDRLARYSESPNYELTIHSWDLAATKGGGDWTVCLKFGLWRDSLGRDILDLIPNIIRLQIELPDVREAIVGQDIVDKPALIVPDGVGIGRSIVQELVKKGLPHILTGPMLGKSNIANQKEVRFQQAMLNLYDGRIRIPASMPGLEIFLAELASFPGGKHDDLVDALSNVAGYPETVIREARRHAANMRFQRGPRRVDDARRRARAKREREIDRGW